MPIKAYGINPENSDFLVGKFLTKKSHPRKGVALTNQYCFIFYSL